MAKVMNSGYGVSTILESNFAQQIEYDSSDRPVYIGLANPGSATSDPRWCIRKLTYSATNQVTVVAFAGGTNEFDKIWDNRASYSYS